MSKKSLVTEESWPLGRQVKTIGKWMERRTFIAPVVRWLRTRWKGDEYSPPVGWVRLGSLGRVTPMSRILGFDRGLPIDRYYIEKFLAHHANDIRGRVLEIQEPIYTNKFGGNCVTKSDVLHVFEGNPQATIVADLTCDDQIPSDTFDCIILTQTLPFIYDVKAALRTTYRILKPGGVVLVTTPGISQISRADMDQWGQYWSFTTLSARQLFEEVFPAAQVQINFHGNVLAAIALMHGMATQELHQAELDHLDPDYQVIITARTVKPEMAL